MRAQASMRDRQLGDHRHVDVDPVALAATPRPFSTLAKRCTSVEQVGVGDGAGVARLALPVVGDLVAAARLDVAVEAVVGDVERAADEPLGEGQLPLEIVSPVRRTSRGARRPGGPRSPRSRRRPRRRANVSGDEGARAKSAGGGNVRSSSSSPRSPARPCARLPLVASGTEGDSTQAAAALDPGTAGVTTGARDAT